MEEKKIAFICPLGEEGSAIRKRSDDIMDNIIKPLAKELNYGTDRADRLYGTLIMDDIITMLKEADIVIADLTGLNPNVFYELGLRQATKGKCINIIDAKENLPFDNGYIRAIKYKYNDSNSYEASNRLREDLRQRILRLQNMPWESCMDLSFQEIANIFGITVVSDFRKGAKNHYALAANLFAKPVKNVFLMQRSSSLVLNAEQGWEGEKHFLDKIREVINECNFFYHIIALDGIEAHIQRKNSVFPHFKDFTLNLEKVGGNVAVKKKNSKNENIFYLRKLPKDNQDTLFKLDRQARVLIVEYEDGVTSAVIVQNMGENQACFLLEGKKAKEYLDVCIEFYYSCELVEWSEITKLYKRYEELEITKSKSDDV